MSTETKRSELRIWQEHWTEMAISCAGLAVVAARFAAMIKTDDPLRETLERQMLDNESWAVRADQHRRRCTVENRY